MLSKAANFVVALCLCCAKFSQAGTLGTPPDDFAVSPSSLPEKRSLQYAYMIYECESPLGPLRENWNANPTSPTGQVCYYNNISRCCVALQDFTSCLDASTVPWPGAFVNGVCSQYSTYDCCYTENGYTAWEFSACYESQEKILSNWNADASTCMSIFLSYCCSETSSGGGAGVAIGIVVGLSAVSVVVAVVCLRHRSCPMYGKMNCTGKSKPPIAANPSEIPVTIEEKPFSASLDPSETATESTNASGSGLHHHFATMANVINSISNVASTVESVSNSINNVAQIASLARGGPLEDLESVTVSELTVSNAEYVDEQGTTVNA
jgi:hypothetical protein